jgi:phospho-2-dehydro-3-deoxyheptonate aldolase
VIEGNQKLGRVQDLRYGVAITDACMEWDSTTESLREAAALMRWTQR